MSRSRLRHADCTLAFWVGHSPCSFHLPSLKPICARVQETWARVDRDFGAIFSTLLPGTQARLVPPEGGTFLDGERAAMLGP